MTWVAKSSRRPTRPSYVPPPFRNTNTTSSSYPNDSGTLYGVSLSSPRQNGSSGTGFGGRSRGRGRGRAYSQQWHSLRDSFNQLDYVRNHFDELDVTAGEENGDTGSSNDYGITVINFDSYENIPVEITGSNVPPPAETFVEIDLGRGLNENIKRCKYVKPTPIQKHAIPIAMAGRDLMACAQTGSGKTAAFCFPIISGILKNRFKVLGSGRDGTRMVYPSALILSPTRELSCQIHDEAHKFAYSTGVKIVVAYGGAPIVQQLRNLEKGVDILVATPGRLVDMIERARVSLSNVKYLALDEADRMLDMGFEPQIRKIVQQMDMPLPGERQTMLFSATFPLEIQRLASDFLSDYIFITVGRVGSSTDLIAQRVELVQDMDKRSHLMDLLRAQKLNGTHGKRALTLVFVETKRGADALEHWLSINGFPAIAIHGDKVQMERERALKSFKSGVTPILVATDVASRGLDIPCVSHVINFDLPKDIDGYVHRIGRTGRAGKSGLATAFFSDKNIPLAKALIELMKEANQEIPCWLTQYAENSSYGSGGRSKRYGGSKFGGYDFRSDAQSWSENYHQSSANGGADPVMDSYGSPSGPYGNVSASSHYYTGPSSDAGFAVPVNAETYAVASQGYGLDHEGVVATGWD